ncbi:hypothetical protein Pcinc_017770 [Petrolisthes cinctipes]|uniref:Major facilitator superfamily associated domain-containing protein n=1 Tax=Petrolisthes cinctipes TaxID=88211 RepID=A0AAE1FQS0_PETCI|nr:hypothetical protein Pcinc_017770 [Petrolisthes cinctipes]
MKKSREGGGGGGDGGAGEGEGRRGSSRWERLKEELNPRRDLMLLKVVLGLNMFALFSSMPYMAVHMRQLGITYREMASILAFQPIGVLFGPPISGLVADKTGHYKLVLCLNSVATAALTVAMLYVPSRPFLTQQYSPVPSSFLNLTCHPHPEEHHAPYWSSFVPPTSACSDNNTALQLRLQNCEPSESPTPEYFMCFTGKANNITDQEKCLNFQYPFKVEMSGTMVASGGEGNNNNINKTLFSMSGVNYGGHRYQSLFCGPVPLLCKWYVLEDPFSCNTNTYHQDHPINTQHQQDTPINTQHQQDHPNNTQHQDTPINTQHQDPNSNKFHNTSNTNTQHQDTHPSNTNNNNNNSSSHLRRTAVTSYAALRHNTSFNTTFWAYLFVRFFWNMFCACTFAMMDATALAILKERGGDYGKQRVLSSLAATVGPAIAGGLVDWYSRAYPNQPEYTPAFYLSCASYLASAALATRLTFTVDRVEKRLLKALKQLMGSVDVDATILLTFLLGFNWGFLETFLFVLMADLNSPHYLMGISAFVANMLSIPVVFVGDNLVRRLGHHVIFLVAFFGYFFREFVYSFVTEPWVLVSLESVKVVSYALPWVAIMKLCPVIAPKGLIATLTGILSPTHHTFGLAAGSFLGGHLVGVVGMAGTFRVFSYISLSCFVLYLVLYLAYIRPRRHRERPQEQEEEGGGERQEEKLPMMTNTLSAVTHTSTPAAAANAHTSIHTNTHTDTYASTTPGASVAHAYTTDTHASTPSDD